ncbi:MAG: DNA polymerase III subunit gamma/tau [Planctomycetota bacterium]
MSPFVSEEPATASNHSGDDNQDSYVVVARRYRPRSFGQLVGQDHVAKALQGAIETHRVGHAYLFTGARGVGKTSTARIFAKALNDPDGPTAEPSNDNDIADAIDSGDDVDVIEIDGASNRGIDEIRSLRANVGVRPSRSRYKIYIIDEVHMLTGAAFNALLKTLEEPPEHVKFIFCTTDPEKIPITVLSRCQRFDFAPVENDKIVERLREIVAAEEGTAEDEALELLARRAAGSMRDSQSLLEQVLSFTDGQLTAANVHAMLGTADDQRLHELAICLADRDAATALSLLDQAINDGIDAGRLAEQMLGYFRDLMTLVVGCDSSMMRYAAGSMAPAMTELGQRWGLQTVLAIVGMIDQTLSRIRLSVHARVLLESTVIQICHLPDLQVLAELTVAAQATGSEKTSDEKKKTLSRRNDAEHGVPKHTVTRIDKANESASPRPHLTSRETTLNRDATINGDPIADSQAAVNSQPVPSAFVSAESSSTAPSVETRGASASMEAVAAQVSVSTPRLADDDQPITNDRLQESWSQVLAEVDPMVATLVRSSKHVIVNSPGQVTIEFAGNAGLAMSRCGKPESKDELARTIRRVTGQHASIVLRLDTTTAKSSKRPKSVAKPINRMQQMQAIETNPLIQSCVELLGAEIIRVDAGS